MRAKPVQRAVRIGAAHGLVQRRDLVVELFAALVETAAATRGDFAHLFDRDRRATVLFLGEIRGDLEHSQGAARIAISAMRERDQRFIVDGQGSLAKPAPRSLRAHGAEP
jgi:hypothetical protein